MKFSHKIIKQQICRMMIQSDYGRNLIAKRRIRRLYQSALPLELVEDVEKGIKDKKDVVEYCIKKWPSIAQFNLGKIEDLFCKLPAFREMDNIRREEFKTDILFCRFAYGFITDEYMTYQLDQKNMEERRTFISEREHMHYYYLMNDLQSSDTLNDKMKTYLFFKNYYGREVVAVESQKDFPVFQKFVKEHPVFVKKEVYESCGKSVEKIDVAVCVKTEKELFDSFISQGKTVLEECITQHPVTEVFNPSSVNTVRVITFNTKHGMQAPYTFMKIGRAGSFVDNGGAGGILVGIDERTGVLNSRGIDELHREYEVHPDSGVKFVGHQLPDWDKAISMCREMAAMMPKVKYIGWDLAYTKDNEWVVIEGNGLSQFIGPQTIWQRGIKEEVELLMRDMDLCV